MKDKGLKVSIPEGFEIDIENSDLKTGCIILKSIKEELEWSDFGKVRGWYLDSNCNTQEAYTDSSNDSSRDIYPTKELAEAAVALCQLLQWRNKVWEEHDNWVPDWTNGIIKFLILSDNGIITTDSVFNRSYILAFPTIVSRDKFLKQHRQLIEQAILYI